MHIRTLIWITISISFQSFCFGQEETRRPWSFGVSAGDILHQLFNADNENRSYAAFVIEYAGNQYAMQAGFRPGYNRQDIHHEGFVDTEVTKQHGISGGIAITKLLLHDQRWNIRAGIKYDGG